MLGHEKGWLTRDERAALIADLPFLTDEELAGKYGRSERTVHRYRTRYHIPTPNSRRRKSIALPSDEEIIALYKQGKGRDTIAKMFCVTLYTVVKVLSRNGLVAPPNRYYAVNITPENCTPALYPESPDLFQFEPAERERYEELKRWKQAKAESAFGDWEPDCTG